MKYLLLCSFIGHCSISVQAANHQRHAPRPHTWTMSPGVEQGPDKRDMTRWPGVSNIWDSSKPVPVTTPQQLLTATLPPVAQVASAAPDGVLSVAVPASIQQEQIALQPTSLDTLQASSRPVTPTELSASPVLVAMSTLIQVADACTQTEPLPAVTPPVERNDFVTCSDLMAALLSARQESVLQPELGPQPIEPTVISNRTNRKPLKHIFSFMKPGKHQEQYYERDKRVISYAIRTLPPALYRACVELFGEHFENALLKNPLVHDPRAHDYRTLESKMPPVKLVHQNLYYNIFGTVQGFEMVL